MQPYHAFDGDENHILHQAQESLVEDMVLLLYRRAADHFLHNARYTFVFPDFVPVLRRMSRIDRSTLQETHDLMAAYYRYTLCPHHVPQSMPAGFDLRKYYGATWKAFYEQEIGLLISQQEGFAEAVANAVCYPNEPTGIAAEFDLKRMLQKRYKVIGLNPL